MAKKEISQPKVVDEVWTDERVRSFLELTPYDDTESVDHYVLMRAYRAMVLRDFTTFIGYFSEASRDINACSAKGETVLALVQQHKKSQGYAQVLIKSGAQ